MTDSTSAGAHTPGPWEVTAAKDHIRAMVTINGHEERLYIASVDTTEVDGYPEQKDANARLIAASPDLFEALEFAMNAMDGIRAAFNDMGVLVPVALHMEIERARIALSKARPQQAGGGDEHA